MIKLIGLKQVPYPGRNLYELFADTKEEVVEGATIVGLPEVYSIPAGSNITIADGTKGYYKSDGTWSWVKSGGGGGQDPVLIEKSITANGDYSAADDEADGYSSVSVDVDPDLTTKNITQNGTYNASDDDADGYSSVTVQVSAGTSDVSGSVIVENGVATGHTMLTMTIPSGVISIANSAYSSENVLQTVILPSTLTIIGENAFLSCKSLETINFPASLTKISTKAFSGCSSLTSIDLSTLLSLASVGQQSFSGCSSLVTVKFPASLESVGQQSFSGCSSLASIDLPDTFRSISSYGFSGCVSLMNIICRAINPPTITSTSFQNVPADCAIYVPAESVEAYKAAQYWSARADYIQAIPAE